jgi:hypothetical protein
VPQKQTGIFREANNFLLLPGFKPLTVKLVAVPTLLLWLNSLNFKLHTRDEIIVFKPFNAGIKSLHATLPDEIFTWDLVS